MIHGSLHIQEHSGGNFLQPAKNQRDITRFDFADNDPLEVIKMLESVLTTVKQQVERQENDKRARQDAANAAKAGREKPLTGRQRRSHLIEDDEDEIEDEEP